jgi:hypothetical protein
MTTPSIKQDPIESDPQFASIIHQVDVQAEENLLRQGRRAGRGFCHLFWREKQRLLKELHGIEWKSPRELNPGVLFD